jgi:hypothetical protein
MKQSTKTTHSSTKNKKPAKLVADAPKTREIAFVKSPWLQEYLDPASLRISPVSERIIDGIAQDLLDWACEHETFTLNSFLVKKQIHRMTFYRWKQLFPKLQWAYDISMMAFADRREVFGLLRKIDPTTAFNGLPKYDEEWKAFTEWKTKLKDPENNQPEITINIPSNSSDFQLFLKWKEDCPEIYAMLLDKMKEKYGSNGT